MSTQSFGQTKDRSFGPTRHTTLPGKTQLSNEERKAAGGLIINLIEPILTHNRKQWVAFWIGVPLGITVFWYLIWNGTFLFADMRNRMLVLPCTFLAGGIGGWFIWFLFIFHTGPTARWKRNRLLELAREDYWARLLAHIRDIHNEDTWRNKRIRTIIQRAFDQANET